MESARTTQAASPSQALRRCTQALALLLAAVGLAGCGDASSVGPTTSTGQADAPSAATANDAQRTLTDAAGEQVTLPARPARVLPLSDQTLDATLALGITPIATAAGPEGSGIPAYLAPRSAEMKRVGRPGTPDLAAIKQLAPDVILLDSTSVPDRAVLMRLRQIAPTVAVSKPGGDWRATFEQTAAALGRETDGADVLAAYDQRVNETKLALRGRTEQTVSVLRWTGKGPVAVSTERSLPGRVLADLGLPHVQPSATSGTAQSRRVSLTDLEQIDADWIFFGALPDGDPSGTSPTAVGVEAAVQAIAAARNRPAFRRLAAFGTRQVVPVDGSAWAGAGGPIAANVIVADIARNMGA
ncbi:MAG: ABC transporter substrate-binding protein [Solirubrobacteraceae bacterium]|nr:ABC transporter substrate-binding protein [Solirubrobacteraceae bacterium]